MKLATVILSFFFLPLAEGAEMAPPSLASAVQQLRQAAGHWNVTTTRYGENGAVGLAGGKTVIVASSRGGFYGADSQAAFLDHQETYLRGVFGFFGITDIIFIRAEGVAMGEPQRQQAIDSAEVEIRKLAA